MMTPRGEGGGAAERRSAEFGGRGCAEGSCAPARAAAKAIGEVRVLGYTAAQLDRALARNSAPLRNAIHEAVLAFREAHPDPAPYPSESKRYRAIVAGYHRLPLGVEEGEMIDRLSSPDVYSKLREGWNPQSALTKLARPVMSFLADEIRAALMWTARGRSGD